MADASREKEEESAVAVSADEEDSIRAQLPHRSPVLFEIIRRSGQEELERPLLSLWWSGLAAGLGIGFSVLAPAMLRGLLPETAWAAQVSLIGYSVGFVIVILSRQQLFTENVITAVVPVMAGKHAHNLVLMLRLWGIVLAANVVGATLFAFFLQRSGAIDAKLASAVLDLCSHLLQGMPMETMARAMMSGFLIAALVWILAGIEGSGLGIIVLMTSLIGIGSFDHVVAGSVEAAYLVLDGKAGIDWAVFRFFLPALAGNLVGGTVIFTLLSYAQIRNELKEGGQQHDAEAKKREDRGDEREDGRGRHDSGGRDRRR